MRAEKSISILAAAAFLLISALPCAAAIGIQKHEDAVIQSASNGDYPRLFETLEKMILEHPVHPVSVLYYPLLFQMADLYGAVAVEKTAEKIKASIIANRSENSALCLLHLNAELERLLYRYKSERGKKITDELRPVRKWTLIGPYERYGAGDRDFVFKPEIMSDSGAVSPQKRIYIADYDGWLDPGKYLYPDRGIVYARVSFRVQDAVKIRIYSRSAYTAFINGKEATRNTADDFRKIRVIRVRNVRGITVLLKLFGTPFERVRLVITDERDAVVEPDTEYEAAFTDSGEVSEELDFPGPYFLDTAGGVPGDIAHLGEYFDNLESREAISYYKKYLALDKRNWVSYLLASALINRNISDQGSAGFNEGWRIMNEIREANPSFIPASRARLKHFISDRDYARAYREGRRLATAAPRDPLSGALFLGVLNSQGYEKEFEELAVQMKKNFPESVLVLEEEAAYYKKRDWNKFMSISHEIINRKFTAQRARSLEREYLSRGDFRHALGLIQKYNFNNDFTEELVEVYIRCGETRKARDAIFRALLTSDRPFLYYALGRIDIAQSDDPSMYFQKLLKINPSLFSVADYNQYIFSGEVGNPFSGYTDDIGNVDSSWLWKGDARYPSTIQYRSKIFIIQNDGSSRIFCEDVISINNEKGVSRYRDILVPYHGNFHPVRLRVYSSRGSGSGLYTVSRAHDGAHITINSLGVGSVIHLSYIVDNGVPALKGSRLFSLPVEYLHRYDEPVGRVSIKVIAPAGMKVNFLLKNRVPIVETPVDGLKQYAISIDGIPPVSEERYAGGKQNCLHYFSFSTVDGFGDFVSWYCGLIAGKAGPMSLPHASFKKENIEETIAAVYDFVARDIGLRRKSFYNPDAVENTLLRKRGSVEDKVLLARAILENLGIRSYIAFARSTYLPDPGGCVSHEYFTSILLCVPLDINDVLWLDFSSRLFRCGVTESGVSGAGALVIINNAYHIRKVRNRDMRTTNGRYTVTLASDGSAEFDAEISFIDSAGELRSDFGNPRYGETSAYRYFGGMIPGFSIDRLRTENIDDCNKPFVLTVRGMGMGMGVTVAGSRRLILEPVLHKSTVYNYLAYPNRNHPLVIEKPINEQETYRFRLPASYAGVELSRKHVLTSRFGSVRISIAKKSGSPVLETEKAITIYPAAIQPGEYREFLNFCLELKRIEYDTVILDEQPISTGSGGD